VTEFAVRPVDADRWADLERLFGPSGAYSGCWCMWWRLPGREFGRNGNLGNRAALEAAVRGGEPVGLLAYAADGTPAGWAAVAPRTAYGRVLRSPALKPAPDDEAAVWSVPCFFTTRGRRRTGVAGVLLAAAVGYARTGGAAILEGYPVDTGRGRMPPAAELFSGTVGQFTRAGFAVHARPATGRRVIMRRAVA
jgi:GNAT superfamily N-acetyltransferase